MADTPLLQRNPLDGRRIASGDISVVPAPAASRLSLRARGDAVGALSGALGLDLPTRPKTSATGGPRCALWLGPDEWLLIDTEQGEMARACAGVGHFHSAVDISHRNLGIEVSGRAARDVLSAGCPQDLSQGAFPVGACSRTVLGKVEIVLWRTGEDDFRVECWRSFADYVFDFLADAARDAAP